MRMSAPLSSLASSPLFPCRDRLHSLVDRRQDRHFTDWLFHRRIHFLGVLLTLAAIYAIGIVTNSLLGKYILRLLDAIIMRLPGIRLLYQGWKQIALTPGGTEGTFSRVVLIPDETGTMRLMGFLQRTDHHGR